MRPAVIRFGLMSFVCLSALVVLNMLVRNQLAPSGPLAQPLAAVAPQSTRAIATASVAPALAAAEPADIAIIGAITRELNTLGYRAGPEDGITRLTTRAAIFAFEQDQGLEITADPSAALFKALVFAGQNSQALPRASMKAPGKFGPQAEQVIRTVDDTLSMLRYTRAKSDGKLTDDLQRAIRAFEADSRLRITGRISAPLIEALMRAIQAGRGTSQAKAG